MLLSPTFPSDPSLYLWAGLGFLVVLFLMLLCMPSLIKMLHRLKYGQTEREEGLASHKSKTGTPTMGGIAFVLIPFIVYAIFTLFTPFSWNAETLLLWGAYLGYGVIGFADDYLIVARHSNIGLKPKLKFGLQSLLAIVLILVYFFASGHFDPAASQMYIGGVGTVNVNVILFFIIAFFMYTGTTNAVNLSDGVDGLCSGLCIAAFIPFICFALWEQKLDVAVILFLVIAGLIGYLFFNIHPAKVFMGDTGSLALGGILASAALVTKMEVGLLVAGMVFIAEALSDIIQVDHYKRTHKRIFLMAPLHHHFEKKGWNEMKVCTVFWSWGALFAILSIILALLP